MDIKQELLLERYRALRAHELELNRATAAFEHESLKPLYLLNGGAIGVLLTLVAALLTDTTDSGEELLHWTMRAVGTWSTGLVLAALATYFAYRSQRGFTKAVKDVRTLEEHQQGFNELYDPKERNDWDIIQVDRKKNRITGIRNQRISIAFGALSLGAFVIGAIFATYAVS